MCEAGVVEDFDWAVADGVPSLASIRMLLRADASVLSRADAVAGAVGVERAKRLLDAVGIRFQAQAAGSAPTAADVDEAAHDLSCAVGMHPQTAVAHVDAARNLNRRLPVTMKALEAGELTLRQAHLVERLTGPMAVSEAQDVEAAAVPGNPRRLRERLERAIARVNPAYARKKAEEKRSTRTVEFWSDQHEGISGAHVQGPADKVAVIKAAIDAEARSRIAGDCRLIGTRRFDVLHSWARQALGLDEPGPDGHGQGHDEFAATDSADAPSGTCGTCGTCGTGATGAAAAAGSAGGRPIRGSRACGSCGRSGPTKIPINVTVSLASLLALSEQPADLNGTPIPALAARELAADGEWRRWIVDPGTGELLDVGATTYRPNAALARYVRARDRTCRFPTCNRPAVDCHLDHVVAFHTAGGRTVRVNLGSVCGHHHRLKHETDWTYGLDPTGNAAWTSPSGRTYITPAEDHGNPDDLQSASDDELADDPALSQLFTRTHARQRHREEREQRQAEERQAGRQRGRQPQPDPWLVPPNPDMKEPPPF